MAALTRGEEATLFHERRRSHAFFTSGGSAGALGVCFANSASVALAINACKSYDTGVSANFRSSRKVRSILQASSKGFIDF
jgi:hypothetical protein